MPISDIFTIVLISLALWLLPSWGFARLFKKAENGPASWKAYVPVLNTLEMMKLAKKPLYWVWLQLIPVAGWFITMAIYIEFVKLFGKFGFFQQMGAALLSFAYIPYIANDKDSRYIGPEGVKRHHKSAAREWVDAAVFAVVAATLIRAFVFEAYQIPTPSMEKSLLVNDFLFVSKTAYGPRVPNTPIAMPFVHHTIPGLNTKAYVEWIKIPYRRWFASPIKRNDVVVFNFPVGDTVINTPEFESQITYYEAIRKQGRENVLNTYPIVVRPVDKQENFIKRCVAISGDTIQLKEGILYVNGKQNFIAPESEFGYNIQVNGQQHLTYEVLKEQVGVDLKQEFGLDKSGQDEESLIYSINDFLAKQNSISINLTPEQVELVKKLPFVTSVTKSIEPFGPNAVQDGGNFLRSTFPQDTTRFKWTQDNFGPLWIPKKGASIQLTPDNVVLYRRCIESYEHNRFEEKDGKYFINGQPATSYTFTMDYFWLMGDNRHNSLDSRYWGFVPEDHVVGKASLIWFSYGSGGIRWNRLFKTIK